MRDVGRHLDRGSLLVILITFALFLAALFAKGLEHDLLLEGGVFLVSVKLILMGYKNSVVAQNLTDRLEGIRAALLRIERPAETRPPSLPARPSGETDARD